MALVIKATPDNATRPPGIPQARGFSTTPFTTSATKYGKPNKRGANPPTDSTPRLILEIEVFSYLSILSKSSLTLLYFNNLLLNFRKASLIGKLLRILSGRPSRKSLTRLKRLFHQRHISQTRIKSLNIHLS